MTYDQVLEQKRIVHKMSGFDIEPSSLNHRLFPFQNFIVRRALAAGKYAIFADCGLGKTFMQLEWAYCVFEKTGKPVLVLAPLAVVDQTIEQGGIFNIPCKAYDGSDFPVQVVNYDQLENVDTSIFDGVVLDECFAPDTKIKVLNESGVLQEKDIKDCKVGEKVLNCTGFDTITDVRRKKVDYAIKIQYNGKDVICSPRHPFFTQRGWVAAKELQPTDLICSTDKAMRVLRGEFSPKMENGCEEAVLRDILFSEMEDEAAGVSCKSSYAGGSSEEGAVCIELEEVKQSKSHIRDGEDKKIESNEEPGIQEENGCYIESDGAQTFSAWGQWSGNDIASAINEGCVVRRMDSGICHIHGQVTAGLSDKLQSRFSELREKNCDRSRWELTPQQETLRQEEGRKTGFTGVESFEILEQTDQRLDRYRDADGSLYFVDLSIERHPSFTINGCLVHNSSILKNFEGATKNLIVEKFRDTPYKLACTATPSPNDPMELGNHAEFLDVMSRNQMLAMYFVHDGGETSKWRLKGHAVKSFYQFVGTWAIMLSKPEDIGFHMDGYDLPPLNLIEKQIVTPQRDNGELFNSTAISATTFNQELRLTKIERMSEVADVVNSKPDENFIIWIKQNEEGEYLKSIIPGAVEVKGSDSNEYKKKMLLGFAKGEFRILITKTKIASFGMNYQNCHNQIFASLDFSFEALYQGMRRSYRFGQEHTVNIYLITTDTMQNVIESINRKQKDFEIMQNEMADAVNAHMNGNTLSTAQYDTESEKTEWYDIRRGDCVRLIQDLPDESIGLSVFSPPFAELYTYSSHLEDMGNSKDYNEFLQQFGFLVRELYRVLKSGRNVAVHCMDLPIQKGKEGFIGLRDFSGMILRLFDECGFVYHSRVTIWKDPVVEMQRTKALGLLHKQIKKDSTMSRVGIPDYVLIFRKDGDRTDPVTNTELPVDLWQKYASPVWMDIDYGDTLQGRSARDEKDEKHIAPLQLQTIERLIHLYSNRGDTVLTPFMGIGSEVFQAVKMGRKGVGFELKESYFEQAKNNCRAAVQEKTQLALF